MKIFISSLIGFIAGLAIFGIGCTKLYTITFFFWVVFGLIASFVALAIEKKSRLFSIFVSGLSMWIAVSVANANSLPKMTTGEVKDFVVVGGILSALTFLPAFMIGLISKFKSEDPTDLT